MPKRKGITMLFVTGLEPLETSVDGNTARLSETTISMPQACGYPDPKTAAGVALSRFGYLFEGCPTRAGGKTMTTALDTLGEVMIDDQLPQQTAQGAQPHLTDFMQFVAHDLIAKTDREQIIMDTGDEAVHPVAQSRVTRGLGNLRAGTLNLDSVYGGGAAAGPVSLKMMDLMRHEEDVAKLGFSAPTKFRSADLLRVGRLIEAGRLSSEELLALPEHLRSIFVHPDNSIKIQTAIIGDARNDGKPALARTHLAFVKLHNMLVDTVSANVVDVTDRLAVYQWARQRTTWHYQWLVVNHVLPSICDPETLDRVRITGAPLYREFASRTPTERAGFLPIPLEFSTAAFPFGPLRSSRAVTHRNSTNVESLQAHAATRRRTSALPPADWTVEPAQFTPPLSTLANEDPGIFREMARRTLREGVRLGLASAQDCIRTIAARTWIEIPRLTPEELTSGATGAALRDGDMVEQTPLWFYLHKEAEVLGQNGRLGPLGSTLVADTLLGLIQSDPGSYWHACGSDADGRWHPADSIQPDGQTLDSLPVLIEAARLSET